MTLRRALDRLPHDRDSEALIKETLTWIRYHPDEWIDPVRVAQILDAAQVDVGRILSALVDCFVLEFDDTTGRYLYRTDRLFEIEIDRFLRRADSSTGMLQNNVEKFRRRYGGS